MELTDRQFAIQFSGVLGVLVVIAIIIYFIANSLAPDYATMAGTYSPEKTAERIAAVGQVNTGEVMEQPAAESETAENAPAPEVVATVGAAGKGKDVYSSVCFTCHDSGVANAPKLGDKAGWEERLGLGVDALYASVLSGKGVMPPKGGRPDLPDDDIKAAVDYMLESVQ